MSFDAGMPSSMTETQRMMLALETVGLIKEPAPEISSGNGKGKAGKQPPAPPRQPTIRTVAELMEMTFPPVQWAVPGIIPEGLAVLAGKSKMGKSWMALNLALAVSQGGFALGKIPCDAGSVLYLAMEEDYTQLQDRLRIMLRGEAPPQGMSISAVEDRDLWRIPEGLLGIAGWLDRTPDARMVVIDTLIKVLPERKANADLYHHDSNIIAEIAQMAKRQHVAVLALHHFRKAPTDDWVDGLLASTGLAGSADTLLGLFRERLKADAVLKTTGRRIKEQELAMQWAEDVGSWSLVGTVEDIKRDSLKGKILEVVRTNPDTTPTSVYNRLLETGNADAGSYDTIKRTMLRMAVAGELQSTGNGKYRVSTLAQAADDERGEVYF